MRWSSHAVGSPPVRPCPGHEQTGVVNLERDRNDTPGPASPGTGTALLVIDMQRGLFSKSTPIYRGDELLAAIAELVRRAHRAGVLVVYVQHSSQRVLPYGSDDWRLHPSLRPAPADLVIHKTHGNAFEGTRLADELAARGISRVVVTGLVTHGCVRATSLGALSLGLDLVLVADGHSSYSRDAAQQIDKWNRQLAEAGARLAPAARVDL